MRLSFVRKSIAVLVLSMTPMLAMAQNLFLKFEGPAITGESTDAVHASEIDVLAYSFRVNQSARSGLRFQNMNITKFIDLASSSLLSSLINGQTFSQVTLSVRNTGEAQDSFRIILSSVQVTGIDSGGSAGDPPFYRKHYPAIWLNYV